MIWLLPDTRAYNLISILCVSGEFPLKSIDLLGSRTMVRRTISSMSQKETYRLDKGDFIKSIEKGEDVKKATGVMLHSNGSKSSGSVRLAKSGQNILNSLLPEEFKWFKKFNYTREIYGYYNDEGHINRNHCVAESVTMMLLTDIEYRPAYMPKFGKWVPSDEPCFYVSRYVKSSADNESDKNSGSRLTGVLFAYDDMYVVYNTRDTVMRWNGATEQKMQKYIVNEIGKSSADVSMNSAIMFGGSDMLESVLNSMKSNRRVQETIYYLYRNVYFIPMNDYGIDILMMLTIPDWHNRLMDAIFKEGERNYYPDSLNNDYDGIRDGRKVVCVIDGNIARMVRVKAQFKILTGEKPIIICTDEQKDAVQSFFADDADIRSIPLSAIKGALGF